MKEFKDWNNNIYLAGVWLGQVVVMVGGMNIMWGPIFHATLRRDTYYHHQRLKLVVWRKEHIHWFLRSAIGWI